MSGKKATSKAPARKRAAKAKNGRVGHHGPSTSDLAGVLVLGLIVSLAACAGGGGKEEGGTGTPTGQVTLRFLDVGQGDAIVVRSGPQRAVLVDTGPDPGPVDSCLDRLGVAILDAVVLSHFHADHAGTSRPGTITLTSSPGETVRLQRRPGP